MLNIRCNKADIFSFRNTELEPEVPLLGQAESPTYSLSLSRRRRSPAATGLTGGINGGRSLDPNPIPPSFHRFLAGLVRSTNHIHARQRRDGSLILDERSRTAAAERTCLLDPPRSGTSSSTGGGSGRHSTLHQPRAHGDGSGAGRDSDTQDCGFDNWGTTSTPRVRRRESL